MSADKIYTRLSANINGPDLQHHRFFYINYSLGSEDDSRSGYRDVSQSPTAVPLELPLPA